MNRAKVRSEKARQVALVSAISLSLHSLLKLSAGLDIAARTDCQLTVANAISNQICQPADSPSLQFQFGKRNPAAT